MGPRIYQSVTFWIMLGVVVWAFTIAWAWNNNRQAIEREAQIVHDAAVNNCLAINELSRKIYTSLADFQVPEHERAKYKPSRNCEKIP